MSAENDDQPSPVLTSNASGAADTDNSILLKPSNQLYLQYLYMNRMMNLKMHDYFVQEIENSILEISKLNNFN